MQRKAGKPVINIWSAGCSSGEEPYTIAMVLEEGIYEGLRFDYSILATDISTKVLAQARKGIYREKMIESVQPLYRNRFMMRGVGPKNGFYRIVPELREKICFERHNLQDDQFKLNSPMHIIFCRNVVIYFNRDVQRVLFAKLYDCLEPGGYLFIGNSETLNGINERFKFVAPSLYRKPGGE
jgi:chemotaxis protein methyltransferase CheR